VNRLWALGFGLCALTASPAFAQYGSAPPRPNPANAKTGILSRVSIDQKIGQQLPLGLTVKDEGGRDVRLGDYFGGKPVVMALAYYECPMLCTQVLNGITGALKTVSLEAGKTTRSSSSASIRATATRWRRRRRRRTSITTGVRDRPPASTS